MPKPSDPFALGFEGSQSLEERPKIAEGIGRLCAEWALLELRMFGVFATLTDAPLPISRAIFYELTATRGRSQMVAAVASAVLGGGNELTGLKELLAKIDKTAKKRNAYIHDPYANPTDHPSASAQIRLSGDDAAGQLEEIESKDLLQLASQVRTWSDALVQWINSVQQMLPPLHERLRAQQALALVLKRRGIDQAPPGAPQRPLSPSEE